jgi:hypothetical protein
MRTEGTAHKAAELERRGIRLDADVLAANPAVRGKGERQCGLLK